MITLPNSNELFREINAIAAGKATAPNNTITPVNFEIAGKTHKANSMWAALEWLKQNSHSSSDVIWQK